MNCDGGRGIVNVCSERYRNKLYHHEAVGHRGPQETAVVRTIVLGWWSDLVGGDISPPYERGSVAVRRML